MAHRIFGKKLGRNTNQRKALVRSLANSVILYEKMTTTKAKAKVVKPYLEKLITTAKQDTLNARRSLIAKLGLQNSVKKLLEVIGPTFKERKGGYLRVTKLGLPRAGDAASMVVIEFVEELSAPKPKEKKKEEKKQERKTTKKAGLTKKAEVISAEKLKDEKRPKKTRK